MWTIKRRHQHIKPETLSEYLDGLIAGPAQARLDRQLAACGVCREELESLQTTAMLLRELPIEAPGRSFTLAAPPPEPVRSGTATSVRVPQWVYAGAASVAAILLAVLVSADATGLLAPDGPTASEELAAAPAAVREAEAGSRVSPQESQALDSVASAAMEGAGSAADDELSQPPPVAMAAAEAAIGAEEVQAAASMAAEEAPAPIDLPEPESASEAVPTESQRQDSSQAADTTPPVAGPETGWVRVATEQGTALFWRFLEGIAGALGLVFLATFVFKRKFSDVPAAPSGHLTTDPPRPKG